MSTANNKITKLQKDSLQHLTISLTEACNLRCKHCIVSSVPASSSLHTMSAELAERLARQLAALKNRGIELITFTGGEPFLAPRQMTILSQAAADNRIVCAVLTSGYWATSLQQAQEIIAKFPHIDRWHLSTDIFHEEFVPRQYILNAVKAILGRNKFATIRMTRTIPESKEHQELYDFLKNHLPSEVNFHIQPLVNIGRGSDIETKAAKGARPQWPCISLSPVIRFDGTVAPCCSQLINERENHPFQYGNAKEVDLALIHEKWCQDPLLRLIKAVGFTPLLKWAEEIFPQHDIFSLSSINPCAYCVLLWKRPEVRSELRRRAELPANRLKIDELIKLLFGPNS